MDTPQQQITTAVEIFEESNQNYVEETTELGNAELEDLPTIQPELNLITPTKMD